MSLLQVDEWIKRSYNFKTLDVKALEAQLKEFDSHLALRSYVVGYSFTLADIVMWGVVRGNRITYSGIKRKQNSVTRWYNFIETSNPWVLTAPTELNAAGAKKKAAASAAGGNYNIGLQDCDSKIVTRFPPEPSGYLHIGHAKAALLNDYFAHEYRKDGTLICRFDDTNPSKENSEFEDSIKHDLALLGVFPDKETYSSDYFNEMYDYCVQLLSDGKAYADDTVQEQMRHERFHGLPSARRGATVAENLARFAEMKSGSEEGQRWCIRAKISVDDTNKALRDPVIYRVNLIPHHRTGDKFKVYPTYDFCVPILDALEGITHALRTTEYGDRNAQYKWMQKAMGLRSVHIWEFSRMNFVRSVLSKRKLTNFVNDGFVSSWDDPRMPTIRGIRRRGMTVPALREFILKQGPSRNVVNLSWDSLWTANKKHIDPIACRYTAVDKEDIVKATVSGINDVQVLDRPLHAKNASLGTKKVVCSKSIVFDQADAASFKQDEEITLMNWGNAYVRNITNDEASGKVQHLGIELHPEGDVKKTEKKITWLSEEGQDLCDVEYIFYDYLVSKDKIEKDEDIDDFITQKTEFRTKAFADVNVRNLKKDDIVQLDRKGFFIVDQPVSEGQPAIFFNIPSGRS